MKISPDVDECFFRLNLCRFSLLFGSTKSLPFSIFRLLKFPSTCQTVLSSLFLPPAKDTCLVCRWLSSCCCCLCVVLRQPSKLFARSRQKSKSQRINIDEDSSVVDSSPNSFFVSPSSAFFSSLSLAFWVFCVFFSSCRFSQKSRDFAAAFVSRVMTAHSQRNEAAQRIAS